MQAIFVDETKGTPKVEFHPHGLMILTGRSLPEDPFTFYNPLIEWAMLCRCENVTIQLRLDYLNTSSAKQIYTILWTISENIYVKKALVEWYYDEDDEDAFETGKEFESIVKIPFTFHACAEVTEI
jgi:hypothetical protein